MAKVSKKIIEEYARLIVKRGANIQKGQDVVIRANLENEDFATLVGKLCYKEGARRVSYQWQSDKADRIDYKYGKTKEVGIPTEWEVGLEAYKTEKLPIYIYIEGADPDGLKGVKPEVVASIKAMRFKALKEYVAKRENRYQWVIAGAPTFAWAKKVFPNLPKHAAKAALWEAILKASRAEDGNGLIRWEEHEKTLKERCEKLNSLRLKSLHYTASNGTDLTVGLIPGVRFEGGFEKTRQGIPFDPNIPTEECFTSPMRGEAEGIVYSAKPLVYQGQIIDQFSLRFEKGKAVEAHAKTGEDVLMSILSLDEGSAYLGECALVPYESPINLSGLIFFSTLYDENAACHLAIGRGFTSLYPGFENMSEEEVHEKGINKSLSHVDFMIGTRDLSIEGTTESGEKVQIFENGTFAF